MLLNEIDESSTIWHDYVSLEESFKEAIQSYASAYHMLYNNCGPNAKDKDVKKFKSKAIKILNECYRKYGLEIANEQSETLGSSETRGITSYNETPDQFVLSYIRKNNQLMNSDNYRKIKLEGILPNKIRKFAMDIYDAALDYNKLIYDYNRVVRTKDWDKVHKKCRKLLPKYIKTGFYGYKSDDMSIVACNGSAPTTVTELVANQVKYYSTTERKSADSRNQKKIKKTASGSGIKRIGRFVSNTYLMAVVLILAGLSYGMLTYSVNDRFSLASIALIAGGLLTVYLAHEQDGDDSRLNPFWMLLTIVATSILMILDSPDFVLEGSESNTDLLELVQPLIWFGIGGIITWLFPHCIIHRISSFIYYSYMAFLGIGWISLTEMLTTTPAIFSFLYGVLLMILGVLAIIHFNISFSGSYADEYWESEARISERMEEEQKEKDYRDVMTLIHNVNKGKYR